MISRTRRLSANVCFLIAGTGLLLLNIFSKQLFQLIVRMFGDIGVLGAQAVIDVIYYLPFVLLPCAIVIKKKHGEELFVNPVPASTAVKSLFLSVACVMLVASVSSIWVILLETFGYPVTSEQIPISSVNELTLGVIVMAAVPGVFEELLFRGVFLNSYRDMGVRFAIMISSVTFAVLHGSVEGFPTQLIMGIVLGLFAVYSGSVFASMMLHTGYNAATILIGYMLRDYDAGEYTTMFEYVGGTSGLITVVVEGVIAVLIVIAILRSMRKRKPIIDIKGGRVSFIELIPLALGLMTALSLYVMDIVGKASA